MRNSIRQLDTYDLRRNNKEDQDMTVLATRHRWHNLINKSSQGNFMVLGSFEFLPPAENFKCIDIMKSSCVSLSDWNPSGNQASFTSQM